MLTDQHSRKRRHFTFDLPDTSGTTSGSSTKLGPSQEGGRVDQPDSADEFRRSQIPNSQPLNKPLEESGRENSLFWF